MSTAGPSGNWLVRDSHATKLGSSIGNPYMFTGRRWDEESGLYYYRARMYSPEIGRFLQPDPLMYVDGMNYYAYVNNNPLNWIDPWGEAATAAAVAGAAKVGVSVGTGGAGLAAGAVGTGMYRVGNQVGARTGISEGIAAKLARPLAELYNGGPLHDESKLQSRVGYSDNYQLRNEMDRVKPNYKPNKPTINWKTPTGLGLGTLWLADLIRGILPEVDDQTEPKKEQ